MNDLLIAIGTGILYIIVMGIIVAPNIGLFFSWIHRKLGARMQWRVGPPIYQPWADVIKLLSKETIVPDTAHKTAFLLAPPLAVASSILASLIMPFVVFSRFNFVGDVIVVIYLMAMPAIAAMIGGSASGNPYASIGVQREMTLIFSYELPFIMASLVPILKSRSLLFSEIIEHQLRYGPHIFSISGVLAFIVCIMVMQAKLALTPFDIPEAKTEIVAGPYTEYSGASLALFKLAHAIMLFVVPCYIANMFLGGLVITNLYDPAAVAIDAVLIVVKLLVLILIATFIRFFNPRIRPDQAFGMFWKTVTILAIIALVLALIGLSYPPLMPYL